MNNKKGFTLIELIVTIVILGLVLLVSVPIYNNMTGKTKQKLYNTKIKTIKLAAANFAEDYKNEIKSASSSICIPIETLIKEGKLISDVKDALFLMNPNPEGIEKQQYLSGQVEVKYENDDLVTDYVIGGICPLTINPGLELEDRYGIDMTPPSGKLTINDGDYTNKNQVTLKLEVDEDTHTFCYSNTNVGKCIIKRPIKDYNKDIIPYTFPDAKEELKHIYVWLEDKYGNVSSPLHGTITYDKTNPIGDLLIDGGKPYTNNKSGEVTLTLNQEDNLSGVDKMCVKNDTTKCSESEWENYAESKTWTLTPNDGEKTISVWYRDRAMNESQMYSKTIFLDRVDPSDGSIAINGGNPYTNNREVTLTLSSTDPSPASGVTHMCISETLICTTIIKYETSITRTISTPNDGTKTYYVYYIDAAGNKSNPVNDTIILDETPPVCVLTGGNTAWTNGTREIKATCSDDGSGCSSTMPSYTYKTEINTTTAGAGGNNVGGTIYDKAGNPIECTPNQTVKIDKTDPTCVSSGGNASWTNGSRTLTGTCSDTGGSECTGNATLIMDQEINTTTASPGTVYDKAGNSVECPANQTVKIDKTDPTCSSSGGNSAWTNTSRTLTGTCLDTGGSECVGNITKTINTETNTTTGSPGTVYDNAGNSVSCPANQTVKIDKTNPTCTVSAKSNTGTTAGVTVTVTGTDTGGSGYSSGGGLKTGLKADTTFTVKDAAGNSGTCSVKVTTSNCNGYNCNPYNCNPYNCNPYNCNPHNCNPYSCNCSWSKTKETYNTSCSGDVSGVDYGCDSLSSSGYSSGATYSICSKKVFCRQSNGNYCYGTNTACSCYPTKDRIRKIECSLSCSTCYNTCYDTCYNTCYQTCYNTCYQTCYN